MSTRYHYEFHNLKKPGQHLKANQARHFKLIFGGHYF